MSDGTIWPCCWTSGMAKWYKLSHKTYSDPDNFYYPKDFRSQYFTKDWHLTFNKWISDITLKENYSLSQILKSESYKKLGQYFDSNTNTFKQSICNSFCKTG